jgi:hypothetical protein
MKYRTDKKVKERIDELLFKNAQLWANLGTKTALDAGSRENANLIWERYADEIKLLDEEFYEQIAAHKG